MSPLEGTPKQIAWAEKIRAGLFADGLAEKAAAALSECEARYLKRVEAGDSDRLDEIQVERCQVALGELDLRKAADWWIDYASGMEAASLVERLRSRAEDLTRCGADLAAELRGEESYDREIDG